MTRKKEKVFKVLEFLLNINKYAAKHGFTKMQSSNIYSAESGTIVEYYLYVLRAV